MKLALTSIWSYSVLMTGWFSIACCGVSIAIISAGVALLANILSTSKIWIIMKTKDVSIFKRSIVNNEVFLISLKINKWTNYWRLHIPENKTIHIHVYIDAKIQYTNSTELTTLILKFFKFVFQDTEKGMYKWFQSIANHLHFQPVLAHYSADGLQRQLNLQQQCLLYLDGGILWPCGDEFPRGVECPCPAWAFVGCDITGLIQGSLRRNWLD